MYKVFLVDDEPFILEGLYNIVRWDELGFEIVGQAENGLDALEKLKCTPVDLLITDISMPTMTGLELIRAIREVKPDLKIVVLSGFDEFTYVKEGMRLGIENYLLKPINIAEFTSTLTNIVEKLHETKAVYEWNRYSNLVLKNNIMQRWMHQQIGWDELVERAGLLGVELHGKYVQVALLALKNGYAENLEMAMSTLLPESSYIVFQDDDDMSAIVYTFDDYDGEPFDMELGIEALKIGLPADALSHIAIGTIENMGDGASRSYANAKWAFEYFMIYPDVLLLRYEDIHHKIRDAKICIPSDWDPYTKLILAKDREAMRANIGELFSEEQMAGLTPDLLREASFEWMVYFRSLMKEIRCEAETEGLADVLSAIRAAKTVHDVMEAIIQTIEFIIELLNRDVKSPVIQQVLNLIQSSYNEDMNLKMLGATLHIHPVYLGRLFHKETGESFTEYLNRYRIEKAKEQLRTTNLKVNEIARNVGYWEAGYFYKQFRKYVGISPMEFKTLV